MNKEFFDRRPSLPSNRLTHGNFLFQPSRRGGPPSSPYLNLVHLELALDAAVLALQACQAALDFLVGADEGEVGGRVHVFGGGGAPPAHTAAAAAAVLLQAAAALADAIAG